MAKKKSKKKGGKNNALLVVVVAVFMVMAGYLAMKSDGASSGIDKNVANSTEKTDRPVNALLIETRPIVNSGYYKGRVAQIYQWAEEVPQAYDALYCYCRCSDNPNLKHKTLLTCYTNDHASKCNICLKEGQMAWEMTQKGMSPKEIRVEVDSYYEKLKRSNLF
ncbi:MAG: hypothetical protein IEMM0002_1371 [bacterium]|nr:MAG: hypothetical protein IEMM0002_1371 [bacterium]